MKKRGQQTKEHRLKISEALRGHPVYKSTSRSENLSKSLTGRKLSKEHRQKMSISMRGKNTKYGDGIPVTPRNKLLRDSIEYKLWRKSIFERDNYTCIWCGFKGYVEADHIKPFASYPELRFAIDNGRTLCKPCHKTTDTYGMKYKRLKTNLKD